MKYCVYLTYFSVLPVFEIDLIKKTVFQIINQINQIIILHLKLAKAEKLKPLEVELRRLEDLSKSIVDDFAYMRAREEEMRDTNGKLAFTWKENINH